MAADSIDSTTRLPGSDHFDQCRGPVLKPEKGGGGAMRDDGATAAGKDGGKHSTAVSNARMAHGEGSSEDAVETSRRNGAGN